MAVSEKRCFKCKATLPVTAFYVHPAMGDGRLNKCKECTKKDVQANYRANREHYREYERGRANLQHRVEAREKYASTEEGKRSAEEARRRHALRNPLQRRAHWALNNAVRDGKIVKPLACECCGVGGLIHGHHEDYSKPLDVEWLCPTCHRDRHRQEAA